MMRSRSRSPLRRSSPGHRRPNGSSGSCSNCLHANTRHNPGPEGPLPSREILKNMVVNPHGVRPTGNPLPIEDVKIPRPTRKDEGTCPIFSFISTRRIVVIAPPREARSSSRDYRRREPGRREADHPVSERRHGRDERRGDERRDHERRDDRRDHERPVDRRDSERQVESRERRDSERPNSETSNVERREPREPAEHRPVRTEAPLPVPAPDQEIHENGGGHSNRRPNQWRPPRPVFYPPPMGYPPMVPPPPWFGPHPPPPRGFVPRGPRHNIRYNN